MTLAELQGLDVSAMWAGLTAEQRADIGAAVLALACEEPLSTPTR